MKKTMAMLFMMAPLLLANVAFQREHKSSSSDREYVVVKKMKVTATAYYGPRRNQPRYRHGTYRKEVRMNGAGKKTALGTAPRIGIVAADFSLFKPGTKLLIEDPLDGEEKIFTVEDTGKKVTGKKIDLFVGFGMSGLEAAEKVGVRKLDVKVVELFDQNADAAT